MAYHIIFERFFASKTLRRASLQKPSTQGVAYQAICICLLKRLLWSGSWAALTNSDQVILLNCFSDIVNLLLTLLTCCCRLVKFGDNCSAMCGAASTSSSRSIEISQGKWLHLNDSGFARLLWLGSALCLVLFLLQLFFLEILWTGCTLRYEGLTVGLLA